VNGSLFSLYSIDLDTAYANDDGPSPVTFFGYDSGNVQIATAGTTLVADGWITLNFPSTFRNLAYVEWDQVSEYHQFDNVNLAGDPVPEPATMLLLGTGLVGVAGAARRRKKNQE
jgi:hypothetical protein